MLRHFSKILATGLALLCPTVALAQVVGIPLPANITVDEAGAYSAPDLVTGDGGQVTWAFPSRNHTIARLRSRRNTRPSCSDFDAYLEDDVNEFTGPMPLAASGIFALGPKENSKSVFVRADVPGYCQQSDVIFSDGTDVLCGDDTIPQHRVLQEVLDNPAVAGVFLRYDWSEIETAPGVFDFTSLDAEIDRIIAAGKVYSLAVKSGGEGMPSWYGDELHLPVLQLRDTGGSPNNPSCGSEMFLGDPTDLEYGLRYNQMLDRVARHLKESTARYRALAYIKASGANLHSHENRLPKRCEAHCPICNTAVWAAHGYTPEGLYTFYTNQFETLRQKFPKKTISYQLIQDGFPKVQDSVNYEGCLDPACQSLTNDPNAEKSYPKASEQTEEILARGTDQLGIALAVQHNGLGPKPPNSSPIVQLKPLLSGRRAQRRLERRARQAGGAAGPVLGTTPNELTVKTCPNEGRHPADPNPDDGIALQDTPLGQFGEVGSGCPNRWVLYEGVRGQVTGFQTNNTAAINTLDALDSTLLNGKENSDAVFIEVYEDLIWLAGRTGGALNPSAADPRTLLDWQKIYNERRRVIDFLLEDLPEPYPTEHSHRFQNNTGADLVYWYTDPMRCDPANPDTIGKITVRP